MLNGWFNNERTGSGTIIWHARELRAKGEIDGEGFIDLVASAAPSVGYCNTMGTATTMNSLAEALGMQLPGSASIPAPYTERGQISYATGKRIVDMVWEDMRPSDIMTKEAFANAIALNSAIGGSTNAPIHLNAIARHIGVELSNDEWQEMGYHIPLLVNLQPAGEYLGEDYHRAGGVPAVVAELMNNDMLPYPNALTVNGQNIGQNCTGKTTGDPRVIKTVQEPILHNAGFLNLKGNLFDSAIMKTSVISDDFRAKYLSNPNDMNAFEGRAVVFDGTEDYHRRIDDPAENIDENCILFMRGAGPKSYPGGAEVVNMRAPAYLLKQGVKALPCLGDGRQSGTSASPSILNASPEAADNGGLAILRNGDQVRIDLEKCTANILISADEHQSRTEALIAAGGYTFPASQTPWQQYFRELVEPFDQGMTLKGATEFQDISHKGLPRDNH